MQLPEWPRSGAGRGRESSVREAVSCVQLAVPQCDPAMRPRNAIPAMRPESQGTFARNCSRQRVVDLVLQACDQLGLAGAFPAAEQLCLVVGQRCPLRTRAEDLRGVRAMSEQERREAAVQA